MEPGAFTVSVHDLENGPKELKARLPDNWLKHSLRNTDVEPAGQDDGSVDVKLTKNGQEVLVQGHLDAAIAVPCARTLDPAIYRIRPEVFLVLAPAEKPQPVRGRKRGGPKAAGPKAGSAKPNVNRGERGGWEKDPVLTAEEAAQDTYSGDMVVLDDFLREFILLEVPMMPLREDLRDKPNEANPALPQDAGDQARTGADEEKPLDPRLSPLAEIKARLEKKE